MKDRNRSNVPIVPDAFEKIEALSESQLRRIFPEYHIVTTTRRDEYDGRYIVKALYPFSPFIALTTDVEHAAKQEGNAQYNAKRRVHTLFVETV